MSFIYRYSNWPEFEIDFEHVSELLGKVIKIQGSLLGKMHWIGFLQKEDALLRAMTVDVVKSSEIEGEFLSPDEVRSSIARRLGMDVAGLVPSDRNVDGVVEMMLDATQRCYDPLTKERLFSWHSLLFPTGRSGGYTLTVGDWRHDEDGPMQVVSGPMGKERVHFQAPAAARLEQEMERFIEWFNSVQSLDPVIKAAIAHFWFVTIHPFDDGNGRIARCLADMVLTQGEGVNQRYYSMSAQIREDRNAYYKVLEQTQRGDLDITDWIWWFLSCLRDALEQCEQDLESLFNKALFWDRNRQVSMNERQTKMVNRLLDGFFGKLTSSKWAVICKCSPDTALRDIQDLINKNVLEKDQSGGRSTSYLLKLA